MEIPCEALGEKPFTPSSSASPGSWSRPRGGEAALDQGEVVLARRRRNILVAAFHPELTDDARVQQLFLQMLARRAR